MKLSDVTVDGKPLVLATDKQVAALETDWWIKFPLGYREYVTSLGEGVLGGFVRIYPPWRIETELADWRKRIDEYWFWDKGKKLLPKARALECIIIGDTQNGDELVFHPLRPDSLFILPVDSEQVFLAGSDLLAAIDWICSSNKLTDKFSERNFEPFDSRKQPKPSADDETDEEVIEDPPGESMAEIIELAKRWAQRHRARKEHTKLARGLGSRKLRYEAIVLDNKVPFLEPGHGELGYIAVYDVFDKSGKHQGFFTGKFSGDRALSSYVADSVLKK